MLVKKWSEALVLYERVLKYAKEVQSKAKSLGDKVGLMPPHVTQRGVSSPELHSTVDEDALFRGRESFVYRY